MQPFVYPATLTPEEQEGGFVVTFPDVPEAITQGDDVTDARRQAADCLEEAIAGRLGATTLSLAHPPWDPTTTPSRSLLKRPPKRRSIVPSGRRI